MLCQRMQARFRHGVRRGWSRSNGLPGSHRTYVDDDAWADLGDQVGSDLWGDEEECLVQPHVPVIVRVPVSGRTRQPH